MPHLDDNTILLIQDAATNTGLVDARRELLECVDARIVTAYLRVDAAPTTPGDRKHQLDRDLTNLNQLPDPAPLMGWLRCAIQLTEKDHAHVARQFLAILSGLSKTAAPPVPQPPPHPPPQEQPPQQEQQPGTLSPPPNTQTPAGREIRDLHGTIASDGAIGGSGRNLIAVIGIDRYQRWPSLGNAVSDARGIAAQLQRLGFEQIVEPLLDGDATGRAVQDLVNDGLRTLGDADSLVLFYAGHGTNRTHRLGDRAIETGYLIPADASDRAASWIELDGWLRAVSLIPARHILVILDACHSGIALEPIIKWRDVGTWQHTPLPTLYTRRSRRIIASALANELVCDSGPVPGHSLFTGCLIDGLRHGLGPSSGRVITGSELGLYLRQRVMTYPQSRQTPDFGTFDFDDRGEMLIRLAAASPEQAGTGSDR